VIDLQLSHGDVALVWIAEEQKEAGRVRRALPVSRSILLPKSDDSFFLKIMEFSDTFQEPEMLTVPAFMSASI